MKTFFMRFLGILCLFALSLTAQAGAPAVSGAEPEYQKIIELAKYIEAAKTQAQNQSPDKSNLFENADQYNFLSPFFLMQTDASPFSGTKGYGAWVDTPVGSVRLISCSSGIKYEKEVFAGVQVKIKDGFRLKKPVLTSALSPAAHVQFLYPIQYPLPPYKTKTETYERMVIFPVLADVTNPNEPFELKVDATLTGCAETACQTTVVPLSLMLSHTEQFPTGICPLMIDVLQDVPVPRKGVVSVQARQNQAGDIQLVFDFKEPTSLVSVQIDNDFSFTEMSKRVAGKKAELTLRPDKPIPVGAHLNLKVITSYGRFDVPVVLEAGGFKKPVTELPWMPIIFGGIGLLIFSPVWSLIWMRRPKNKKTLKSEMLQTLMVIGSLTLVVAGIWQAGLLVPKDFIQSSIVFVLMAMAALIYLIVRPNVSLMGAVILFWFVPKPYVANALTSEIAEPFFMVCWWGLVLMAPFALMYRYAVGALKFIQILTKTPVHVQWIVRMPFMILLGWLMVASFGNMWVNQSVSVYTPQAVTDAVDTGKIAFVSVEPPVCFSCVWNKAVQLKTGYARYAYRRGELISFYMPVSSVMGQDLIEQSGTTHLPLNLLYGPGNKNGIVLPPILDYFDLKEQLKAVREP